MPLEETPDTHAKVIPFLQITQDRSETFLEPAYPGVPSYSDHPVALHCKAEGPFGRADVPGLCANRIHCADTLDSHIGIIHRSDAQVVHAWLAAIVMKDNPTV